MPDRKLDLFTGSVSVLLMVVAAVAVLFVAATGAR